jgi:choline-sulfatase
MVRRGDFKLAYYYNEPPELFNVVSDPGEFTNLAEDPAYATVREELLELILRNWDPARLDQTARESQRLRRIVIEGSPHLSFAHWDPADDNWLPMASAVAALTD